MTTLGTAQALVAALELIHGARIWHSLWIQFEGIDGVYCGGGGGGRGRRDSADHAPGLSLIFSDQRSHRISHCRRTHALVRTASDQGAGRGNQASSRALALDRAVPPGLNHSLKISQR